MHLGLWTVLELLTTIKQSVTDVKQQAEKNTRILQALTNSATAELPDDLDMDLPIADRQALESVEQELSQNRAIMKSLVWPSTLLFHRYIHRLTVMHPLQHISIKSQSEEEQCISLSALCQHILKVFVNCLWWIEIMQLAVCICLWITLCKKFGIIMCFYSGNNWLNFVGLIILGGWMAAIIKRILWCGDWRNHTSLSSIRVSLKVNYFH